MLFEKYAQLLYIESFQISGSVRWGLLFNACNMGLPAYLARLINRYLDQNEYLL